MSDLYFRIAKQNDTSLITSLVNAAYRGESSRQGWTTEADLLGGQRTDKQAIHDLIKQNNNVIILCLNNNEAVGTVHLRCEGSTCHFGMFTVRPDLQGQGIGKNFISYAEQYAQKEWSCGTMSMTVIDLRHELLQWYERRGYLNTGEAAEFPYGDERYGLPKRDDLKLTILEKSLV